MISVIDYGAVGNGVTDDTAAFNAALAIGGPVLIPFRPSGYVISSALYVTSNSGLIGEPGTKIIHKGESVLVDIRGQNIKIVNLNIDSTLTTDVNAIEFWGRTDLTHLKNIHISEIKTLNSRGLFFDCAGGKKLINVIIEKCFIDASRGYSIYLAAYADTVIFRDLHIDYRDSLSPNFPAITINTVFSLDGGVKLDNVYIHGTDNSSHSNQHGIVAYWGEHHNFLNCTLLFLGGNGIKIENGINFRMDNCNVSFCHGDQITFINGQYNTIANVMTRGRANGSLNPLNITTYGLILRNCLSLSAVGCNFKSCGAGVWIDGGSYITISGSQFGVNRYYGVISTGASIISAIIGCHFEQNQAGNIVHSSSRQYASSCLFNGSVSNFMGAGLRP